MKNLNRSFESGSGTGGGLDLASREELVSRAIHLAAPQEDGSAVRGSEGLLGDTKKIREYAFEAIVHQKILESFYGDLQVAGFSEVEMAEIKDLLVGYNETELNRIVSVPFEIRNKMLTSYAEDVHSGSMSVREVFDEIIANGEKQGFSLGYHATNNVIKKEAATDSLGQEIVRWEIKPTELDDRDEMNMAYYSEDLDHVYGAKGWQRIYIIRAQKGPESTHKLDGNNRWGRAHSLPIVDCLEMPADDVRVAIDEITQDMTRELKA